MCVWVWWGWCWGRKINDTIIISWLYLLGCPIMYFTQSGLWALEILQVYCYRLRLLPSSPLHCVCGFSICSRLWSVKLYIFEGQLNFRIRPPIVLYVLSTIADIWTSAKTVYNLGHSWDGDPTKSPNLLLTKTASALPQSQFVSKSHTGRPALIAPGKVWVAVRISFSPRPIDIFEILSSKVYLDPTEKGDLPFKNPFSAKEA